MAEVENAVQSNVSNVIDDEARIEVLLSERLMDGYVLLEKSCPVCATPLVKKNPLDEEENADGNPVPPVMVPSGSFDQPFKPVDGVPFCVGCTSHVITQECEISILERCDSLKAKGSILVALQDASYTDVSGSQFTPSEQPEAMPSLAEDKAEDIVEDSLKEEPSEPSHVIDVTDFQEPKEPVSVVQESVVSEPTEISKAETPQEVEEKEAKNDVVVAEEKNEPISEAPVRMERDISDQTDEKKEEHAVSATPTTQDEAPSADNGDRGTFENQNADELMEEYSVRREIATKVLGAKMLQGYTLKETQCEKCGMPLMEYNNKLDCVVCPALVKKAKKKMKAQQKLTQETNRIEQEIEAAKAKKALEEKQAVEIAEKERREAEKERREVEAEIQRVAALEAEEARLVAEAKSREKEGSKISRAVPEVESRKTTLLSVTEDYKRAEEKRRQEEVKLIEETKRLEEMEERCKLAQVSTTEKMKKDLLTQEHRLRLQEKVRLDEDILILEQGRLEEEMETRKLLEEKRASNEAKMIATLEEEAASKAKAAQDAILKAKAALEHVSSARRDIIAQTIAMAEAEAVQEAENLIKAEREDYRAPVVLPSASEVEKERWETLRTEGRSVMTRRVMAGWVLLSEFCQGSECHSSPLITKNGMRECVVCGGCGNGNDGAYDTAASDENEALTDPEILKLRDAGDAADIVDNTPASPTANFTSEELQDDFETKRDMVSKEIGKKMILGWTLLDASCKRCVMPLMMDNNGKKDICILCHLINNIQDTDGHTIRPPVTTVPSAEETAPISTRGDATTIDSTLPTKKSEAELVSSQSQDGVETILPEPDRAQNIVVDPEVEPIRRDPMVDSIRRQANKRAPANSPRGDPPASLKKVARKVGADPDDTTAVKSVIATNKTVKTPDSIEMARAETPAVVNVDTQDDVSRMTGKNDADVPKPAAEIAKMFLESPLGYEAIQNGETFCRTEEMKDTIDFFATTSLKQNLAEAKKEMVVTEVIALINKSNHGQEDKAAPTTQVVQVPPPPPPPREDIIDLAGKSPRAQEVIHLEDLPSPSGEAAPVKAFNFETVSDEKSVASVHSKRTRPTPESMFGPRSRSKATAGKAPKPSLSVRSTPPRPDSTRVGARPPRPSPRAVASPRRTPHSGGVVVVGGPGEFENDHRSLCNDDVSRCGTVASQTLDSILSRIEDCKAKLGNPNVDVQTQVETAALIEKLAQAAVAVKKLEELDI